MLFGFCLAPSGSQCTPPQQTTTQAETELSKRPIYLTVRITPNVKPKTIKYIDQTTKGRETVIKKGETLAELTRRIYGYSNKPFRNILHALRPTFAFAGPLELDVDEVSLPCAARWSGETEVRLKAPVLLRDLAASEIGFTGEKTQKSIESANPSLKGRWNDIIRPGETVRLPYVTGYCSVPVKTGSIDEARTLAARIKKMDPDAVAFSEAEYSGVIAPNWEVASANFETTRNPAVTVPPDWWFGTLPPKWSDLNAYLQGKATVAILDTGIVKNDSRFRLWNNQMVGHSQGFDNPCPNDEHGCNFFDPPAFPEDDCKVASRYHHGTHIAGLASARLDAADLSEVDKRVDLMILKVADDQGNIAPDNLLTAIYYAGNRRAKVINLSLTADPSAPLLAAISSYQEVVFVAASGNPPSGQGVNLDDPNLNTANIGYPARLSSPSNRTDKPFRNVISVASHDPGPDYQLSTFSNWGERSIDLAAPGSQIESIVDQTATKKLDGTSQATALVTLAAALLASEGVPSYEIKRRIISTVDFVPALNHKVSSAGKLNIANALDLKHDIVRTNTELLRGCIISPDKFQLSTEKNDLTLHHVRRILLNYSLEAGKTARVTTVEGEDLVYKYGDVDLRKIEFVGAQGPQEIDPSNVLDIIPTRATCSRPGLPTGQPR